MIPATRPQLAAMRGLLVAAGLTVLDGGDGDPVPPCVVLWPTPGDVRAGSLSGVTSDLEVELTTVVCGESVDQAMWVADRVQETLLRATPTVAGRTSHPIRCVWRTAVTRDDDVAPGLWFASLRWLSLTTPQ